MRRRPSVLLVAAVLLMPHVAMGQASQFGVRGLGLPSLPVSVRAAGAAGALGLFDGFSALNPAALYTIDRPIASMNVTQSWRSSDNLYGRASGNDTHFPLFIAGGQISSRLAGAVSASVYTDRTFALASQDTLVLRDQPVVVDDTLASTGGLSDLRMAMSYRLSRVVFGLGVHLVTGTNRMAYRRTFSDTTFIRVDLRNELAAIATGISAGILFQPTSDLVLGVTARLDSKLSTEKDSVKTGSIPMPRTLGAGVHWRPSERLAVAGHLLTRTWSRSDAELRARGGAGAVDTREGAIGLEFARSGDRPTQFPIRLGVRWAQLPFPLSEGLEAGHEMALTLGTGFRFSGGRAGVDLGLERVWRDDGDAFKERSTVLRVGITVRQ